MTAFSNFLQMEKALMRPTSIYSLSTELGANTIDPDKLNCRVRNVNGCCLTGNNISLIKAFCNKRTNLFTKELLSTGTTTPLQPVGILLAAY